MKIKNYDPTKHAIQSMFNKMKRKVYSVVDRRYNSGNELTKNEVLGYNQLIEESLNDEDGVGAELIVPLNYHHFNPEEDNAPTGGFVLYNINARLNKYMFAPKRTCMIQALYEIENPITHHDVTEEKCRKIVDKFIKQCKSSDDKSSGPTLSTYGIDDKFLSDKNAKIPVVYKKDLSHLRDKERWVAKLSNSNEDEVSLKYDNDRCFIYVCVCAEASSMELQKIIEWYQYNFPDMQIDRFMEKTCWYDLHKLNCERVAGRLAYNLASMLFADVKHIKDKRAYVKNKFTDCPPFLAVPYLRQVNNCMVKLDRVDPCKYKHYMDVMSYKKCCNNLNEYFPKDAKCYGYFSECDKNILYHNKPEIAVKLINDHSSKKLYNLDISNKLQKQFSDDHHNKNDSILPIYQRKLISAGPDIYLYETLYVNSDVAYDKENLKESNPALVAFPTKVSFKNKQQQLKTIVKNKVKKEEEKPKKQLSLVEALNHKNVSIDKKVIENKTHHILYDNKDKLIHPTAGKSNIYQDLEDIKASMKGMGYTKDQYHKITHLKPFFTKYSIKV